MLCIIVQNISRLTRRGVASSALVLAGLLSLGSPEASASPVFFNPSPGFGISESDALNAIADYGTDLELIDLNAPPQHLRNFVFTGAVSSGGTDCTGTNLSGCVALRITLNPGLSNTTYENDGSVERTSGWTVTNITDQSFGGALLIFTSSLGAITEDPSLVGLEPDPADGYVIIEYNGFYAAAIDLGALSAGESTTAMVHYRVNDFLEPAGDDKYYLPWLITEAAVAVVPEPGAISLFSLALLSAFAFHRRR